MKNKVVKSIVGIGIITILVMVVLLTQLVSPLWITSKKASCDTWDAVYESLEYEEEEFKRDGSKADEGEQWISFNGTKTHERSSLFW